MNRRTFVSSAVLAGVVGLQAKAAPAAPSAPKADAVCVPNLDFISAEATYFSRYEHFHLLSIPVSVLIKPPVDGYVTRTSPLDQGSLDEAAFKQFIKESGINEDALRHHSHEVRFTQAELARIASGEQNVEIVVLTPRNNLAHRFYFTATKSALVKIKRGGV